MTAISASLDVKVCLHTRRRSSPPAAITDSQKASEPRNPCWKRTSRPGPSLGTGFGGVQRGFRFLARSNPVFVKGFDGLPYSMQGLRGALLELHHKRASALKNQLPHKIRPGNLPPFQGALFPVEHLNHLPVRIRQLDDP